MRKALVLFVTLMLSGLAVGAADAQSDFPDPAGWDGSASVRVFEQNSGALLSGIYRRGGFNNGAATFATINDLPLRNPNAIGFMEATVTLVDGSLVGSGFTVAPRAGLEGLFYWNGTGTGSSTDQTGHVNASLNLALNASTGEPTARYFIVRCTNPGCTTTTSIADAGIKPVNYFEPHRLKIGYDGAAFTFQVDEDTPVVVAAPDGTRLPPTVPFKALRTRLVIPASPTASASVLALYEQLTVNGAPYDEFSVKELPRVQILPGSGTFSSNQSFDLVIMVETAGESVSEVKFKLNGADLSHVLPLAVPGTLPSGGVTYRFPDISAAVLGLDTPSVLGVEATTASGKTARGFAVWNAVAASE